MQATIDKAPLEKNDSIESLDLSDNRLERLPTMKQPVVDTEPRELMTETQYEEQRRQQHASEDVQRKTEIARIQEQSARVPAGTSNIRKLIKMKATL